MIYSSLRRCRARNVPEQEEDLEDLEDLVVILVGWDLVIDSEVSRDLEKLEVQKIHLIRYLDGDIFLILRTMKEDNVDRVQLLEA